VEGGESHTVTCIPACCILVSEPDNMDAMELDYRVRLAEIQRKYKEKQKQLAKLHHKKR